MHLLPVGAFVFKRFVAAWLLTSWLRFRYLDFGIAIFGFVILLFWCFGFSGLRFLLILGDLVVWLLVVEDCFLLILGWWLNVGGWDGGCY